MDNIQGSPPRVREKLTSAEFGDIRTRITPACAGKTTTKLSPCLRKRDHPRVCGKNALIVDEPKRLLGSPPRVREKLLKSSPDRLSSGITPACAGKTAKRSSSQASITSKNG